MNDLVPTDPSQADPAVVALLHGTMAAEGTLGKPNIIGDQGTAAGVGQWSNQINGTPTKLAQGQIPANFTSDAKQYGLDPTDFSIGNQKKVLYAEIASGKKAGLTPEQILSQHNSGDPNKYLNSATSTGTGPVGAYNVADYVKRGMNAAQQYAQANKGAQSGIASLPGAATPGEVSGSMPGLPNLPAAAGVSAPQTPPPAPTGDASGGFLSGLQEDLNGTNPNSIGTQLENTAKGVGNFLLPSIGDTYNDLTGQNKKTVLQQFGDAGSTLLGIASVIPGLDAIADPLELARGADVAAEGASKAGLLSAVGKNAALGGAFGVSGAIGQGKTNIGDIATSGLVGAGTGGVLGGVGELAGNALSKEAGKTGETNLKEFTTVRKTLNKALTDNSRKATADQGATDPISTLAQSGLIKDLKVTQGKIDGDALTNGNGTGSLDSAIESHSQDASTLVKELSKQPGIPLDQFKASAEADIKNDPGIRGSLTIPKALSVLDSKLESAKISYGDTLSFDAIDEIRKGMNSVYDPNDRDAARVIGDTARNFLYHGDETNAALKSAMANESELIRARNYVQKLHGTSVGKGMQKIAHEIIGSGIGGTIGSIGGPIGAGVGAMATGAATKAAEDALSSNKFDPLGAKVAQGLLNVSKNKVPQIAGRAGKAGILRGVSQI